jgi:pentapeptide MXKDX repeat protein
MHSLFDAVERPIRTPPRDLLHARKKISQRYGPGSGVTAAEAGRRDQRRRDRLSIEEDHPMNTSVRISLLASALVAVAAFAAPAIAQDKMGHDAMKQDQMSKDHMKKGDAMTKDGMSKDAMKKHDGMKNDAMKPADGMKK